MKQPPTIIMQLVHIGGPLKGEIQEYPEAEVTIGRNPSCGVRFPKDLGVVSRQHARIVREGNRFKVIDQSSNGTYLNGKAVSEAYLKDGDVLMFAEGGPKVSFLTQTVAKDSGGAATAAAPSPEPPREAAPAPFRTSPAGVSPVDDPPASSWQAAGSVPSPSAVPPPAVQPPPTVQPRPAVPPSPERAFDAVVPRQATVQNVKKSLYIQYGPTLRSYNEMPVTIGQGSRCDFVLNHPSVFERHAQIFYSQEQYWVKDLSGKNPIMINGRPVDREAVLEPDCRLSLSPGGPEFRFLGGGRLAEIEAPAEEAPAQPEGDIAPEQQKRRAPSNGLKDIGGMLKRFLNK